ncbi:hypothetical protein [Priestia endophytica]|uniref:hypothetical protein n=1 Tax=Priestia endophytica TaxID=135735 RepID=UPI000DCA6B2A|nr:hypothetical protein [Priestia endophytica]RAS73228.1 hypothetical protein A4R27_24890 [Priestia endophytica]
MAYTEELDPRVIKIAQKLVDQEEKKEAELKRQELERREEQEKKIREMEEQALTTPIQFVFGDKVINLEYGSIEHERVMEYVYKSGKFVEIEGVLYSLDELVKVNPTEREKELEKLGLSMDGSRKNPITEFFAQEREKEWNDYFGKQIVIEGDLRNEEGRDEALEIASQYLNKDIKEAQEESEIELTKEEDIL